MVNNNIVDFIITDDSDLTIFGAKRIAFKLETNGKFK